MQGDAVEKAVSIRLAGDRGGDLLQAPPAAAKVRVCSVAAATAWLAAKNETFDVAMTAGAIDLHVLLCENHR
jgi:hypothetical protein